MAASTVKQSDRRRKAADTEQQQQAALVPVTNQVEARLQVQSAAVVEQARQATRELVAQYHVQTRQAITEAVLDELGGFGDTDFFEGFSLFDAELSLLTEEETLEEGPEPEAIEVEAAV